MIEKQAEKKRVNELCARQLKNYETFEKWLQENDPENKVANALIEIREALGDVFEKMLLRNPGERPTIDVVLKKLMTYIKDKSEEMINGSPA